VERTPRSGTQVRVVRTAAQRQAAYAVRLAVFQLEQGIAREEEFDDDDESATHVLATYDGEAIGTGRLLEYDGYAKIGRMAVLAPHRRLGVGAAIVRKLMRLAQQRGHRRFVLHAQVRAIPFYEALGFTATGPEFDEANIPHRRMERVFPRQRSASPPLTS